MSKYRLESYSEAQKILSTKTKKEIFADGDLMIMFAMFVSHCFNGYDDAVLNEGCQSCYDRWSKQIKEKGEDAARKQDLLNSKEYRLKNKHLRSLFWVDGNHRSLAGVNLTDEHVKEKVKNGQFDQSFFEYYPSEWFEVDEEEPIEKETETEDAKVEGKKKQGRPSKNKDNGEN